VLARRGQLDQAEGLAREAVALAERADFMLAHAEATADLGEVLELAGKPAEAIRALESAASIYERKGVVIAVTLTRARIDEIASAV
jgi:tetratricopeptide (TPR) repeat protein